MKKNAEWPNKISLLASSQLEITVFICIRKKASKTRLSLAGLITVLSVRMPPKLFGIFLDRREIQNFE